MRFGVDCEGRTTRSVKTTLTTILSTKTMTTMTESIGAPGRADPPHSLSGVLDQLRRSTEGRDSVDVRRVVDIFAARLIGPMLIIPALLLISPIGAVPFLPAVLAIFILLVAGQTVVTSGKPWIPRWLAKCSLPRERLVGGLDKLKSVTRWVDKLIKPRASALVEGPMERVLAVTACVLALLVFPLAPIPFAVQLPAWGLVMIGLSLIARDGALAAIGLALACGAVGLALWMLL